MKRVFKDQISLALFLCAFLSYSYFYQGGGQNEAARFDTMRALLDQGRLDIGPYIYNSADIIFYEGRAYSGKAPGTFFVGLPAFATFSTLFRFFGMNEDLLYHLTCYLTTIFSIALAGALSVVLIYRLGRRLQFSEQDSVIAALTLGFGSMMFPFSTLFFSHVGAAFCLLLGYYLMLAHRLETSGGDDEKRAKELWRLSLGGFALGFAVTFEYPAAIGAFLIGIYAISNRLLERERRTELRAFISGGVIGLSPLIIYNILAFKNPFYLTYEAYAKDTNHAFEDHKRGFLGIRLPFTDATAFAQFIFNLKQITIKPLRGLFYANPVFLAIFPGFWLALKQFNSQSHERQLDFRKDTWLALFIFLGYLTLNASFGTTIVSWGGGTSFGPRYLITALPFLAIPVLAALASARWRPIVITLLGFSVFHCLMATAIEPKTPYAPENPYFFYYLPRFMTGLFSFNPDGIFSGTPVMETTVAFNWGRVLRLPLSAELYPLYAIWLLSAWWLDRKMKIPARGFLFATGIICSIAFWLSTGSHA